MATDVDGLGPLPFPDDFDDVLPLLGMADFDNAEDPPSCSHSFSANALLYWPGMIGNYSTGNGAPGVVQPNGLPVHVEPSTSSTAAARHADVLDCSACQLLREVIHTNGLELMKLRIHGAANLFYHATLEVYPINSEGLATALAHQSFIDLRGRDYELVRHYLTNYALQRAAGNHAVVRDSLSTFHDVLCTTMNPGIHGNGHHDLKEQGRQMLPIDNGTLYTTLQSSSLQSGKTKSQNQQGHLNQIIPWTYKCNNPCSGLQAGARLHCREKTRNMHFQDIAPYFHLPIVEAAENLDVCTTVLKGVCRRVGVQRWPHRKVKKIDRQITKLRRSGNGAWERDEIERLNADRERIFYVPE